MLETIINKGIENIKSIKKTAKNTALIFTLGAGLACFTGCDKLQHPLSPQIQGTVQQTAGAYCGNQSQFAYTPLQTPCNAVDYRVCMPGAGAWSEYQTIQADSDGKFKVTLNSSNPGDGLIQFCANGKEDSPITFKYYMNESQSDQALSEAITEIGVVPVSSALEDAITDKWCNQSSLGYTSDAVVAVKSTAKRSASNPRALYYIDVQGSDTDTMSLSKKVALNANGEGYIHIGPVQSKDEIKQAINSEKSLSWPEISNISTGYTISTKSGDIFNGEATYFQITSAGANAADISVKTPSGSYGAYEALTKSGNDFKKNLTTSEYGDHKAKFRLSLDRTVMNEVFDVADEATSSVFMNDSQALQALEDAIKEVGISGIIKDNHYHLAGGDPTTVAENEIMCYWMNLDDMGYHFDALIGVKCDRIYGPPSYEGGYYIDIKSNSNKTFSQTKKDTVNNTSNAGYVLWGPVQSKEEIKQLLINEKSTNWSQID
jgi:hypothetical protein